MQGYIVKLIDSEGKTAVEYKYDAWGKAFTPTGTLAGTLGKVNPFRYRGYVYDEETKYYYLRSRYYDPELRRFINSDSIINAELFGNNQFTYCINNPISRADYYGKASVVVGGGAAVGIKMAASALGAIIGAIVTTELPKFFNWLGNKMFPPTQRIETDVVPEPGPAPEVAPTPNASMSPSTTPGVPDYPGDDPLQAPDGYEWRGRGEQGSGQGNYFNPETGESLHPDLDHAPPIGPHWDYWSPKGGKIRIYPE